MISWYEEPVHVDGFRAERMQLRLVGLSNDPLLRLCHLLHPRESPTLCVQEIVISGVDGHWYWVLFPHTFFGVLPSLSLCQRFLSDLPCLPFDLKIVLGTFVLLWVVAFQWSLVRKDLAVVSRPVPCLVSFDVIDDLVVGNDFLIISVYEAFESYHLGLDASFAWSSSIILRILARYL